jgi:hypothetical protein
MFEASVGRGEGEMGGRGETERERLIEGA